MNIYYKTTRPLWHFLLFSVILCLLIGGAFAKANTTLEFVQVEFLAAFIGFILGIVIKVIVEVVG